MTKFVSIFILAVLINLFSLFVRAESDKVHFEWELIPDSIGYEIQIVKIGETEKDFIYSAKSNFWDGNIAPGHYKMRIRSVDDRQAKSEWSEFSEFSVKLSTVELKYPNPSQEIKTNADDIYEIKLSWNEAEGAKKYRVKVLNSEGEVVKVETVKKTSTKLKLSVAQKYQWNVQAIISNDNDELNSTSDIQDFILIGGKLSKPRGEKPENKFVNKVRWEESEKAESYNFSLFHKLANGKWRQVEKVENIKTNEYFLKENAPGGKYQVQVKGKAKYREDSDLEVMTFNVHDGDRSPAAVESHLLRESLEKNRNKYLIGSYFISNLSYKGENKEVGKPLEYNTFGGTARIGYGYLPLNKQGFISTFDYSGLLVNGKNYRYSSLEIQAVWRRYIFDITQLRYFVGGFARETPEAKGLSSDSVTVSNVAQAGPQFGIQLWHPLNYIYGIQLNYKYGLGLLKLYTPNNKGIGKSSFYEIGVLGSYRMHDDVTGFVGYAYRDHSVTYKAKPYDDGEDANNFADPGDENSLTLSGHYLNLYLEWEF